MKIHTNLKHQIVCLAHMYQHHQYHLGQTAQIFSAKKNIFHENDYFVFNKWGALVTEGLINVF